MFIFVKTNRGIDGAWLNSKTYDVGGTVNLNGIFATGEKVLRQTRINGEDRSIFCGIGICWDCVVTVDGVMNQRSCLIEVQPGMVVTS